MKAFDVAFKWFRGAFVFGLLIYFGYDLSVGMENGQTVSESAISATLSTFLKSLLFAAVIGFIAYLVTASYIWIKKPKQVNSIERKFYTIDRVLLIQQKVILSITAFIVHLLFSYSIIGEFYPTYRLDKTWWMWSIFLLIQAWFQNKVWSNSFKIAIKYPYIPFSKLKKPLLITTIIVIVIGALAAVVITSQEYPSQTEQEAVYVPKKTTTPANITQQFEKFEEEHTLPLIIDGSGEAKGLKFMVSHPFSFETSKVNKPNVVAKASNKDATFYAMYLVYRYDNDISYSKKVETLSKQTMKNMLTSNFEYIDSDTLTVDGEMAAYVDGYIIKSEGSLIYRSFNRMYYIIYKNYLIQINCYVGDTIDKYELKRRFDSYKPVMDKMINSMFILSKGKRSLRS